ncbi:NADPH-dependent oxidoreductase [Shouchella sp. 1P09AA]|uniref:NADPH-dependent oxidoreductase n=1 Tax=unclassified Shouchella TaxID=2893065 RepID=UPI0039A08EE0
MNETIATLKNHYSVRNYLPDPIKEEQLQVIIEAAQAAPTWGNAQQLSIVGVTDVDKKKKLSEIIGQPWIDQAPVFLSFNLDFHRISQALEADGQSFEAAENVDTLLVGTTDVGIAMGNAIAAAESMGLGIVPIGAIRTRSEEVVSVLDLPKYVFPIVGLVIGYPDEINERKPRLPVHAFYHKDSYQHDQLEAIQQYEDAIKTYMQSRPIQKTWTETVARYYSHDKGIPQTSQSLEKQGFHFRKND